MAGWCCMCRSHCETWDHLLIHCVLVAELWGFIFKMFGIQWVFPRRVVDLLFGEIGLGNILLRFGT